MKSVHVTVDARILLDEDDIGQEMEAENVTEAQAIMTLAMRNVPDEIEGYSFKVRDITVHISSLC